MKNFIIGLLSVIGVLLFFTYAISLMALGYIGVEEYLGTWWAIGALVAALLFRFTLPIVIGSVYGAMIFFGVNVWLALIIVMPNLLFVIPALAIGLFTIVTDQFRTKKHDNQYVNADIIR